MLVVINPSGEEAGFAYNGELGDVIYQNGGELVLENGKLTVPGASAVFVREQA